VIDKELDAIRYFIASFDNSPGPEPAVTLNDIQNALRPVLAALEKLAALEQHKMKLATPAEWFEQDGHVWTRAHTPGYLLCSATMDTLWRPDEAKYFCYRTACAALWPDFKLPDI
jgi:hypothetical protein